MTGICPDEYKKIPLKFDLGVDFPRDNGIVPIMRLENYSIQKVKEFATERHVNYQALKTLLEGLGLEFPRRGEDVAERYHHVHANYKYITMIHPRTGNMVLYNLDKDDYSSLDVNHPAVIEGWEE